MTTKIKLGEIYKINYRSHPAKKFDEVVPFSKDECGYSLVIVAGHQKGATIGISHERIEKNGLITQYEFDNIDWETGKLTEIED